MASSQQPYQPFSKIPPEILSHILSIAYLSFKGDESHPRFCFPSITCQVNRAFHRIVLSTSLLWSYILITDNTDLGYIKNRIERRTGARPLSIYVATRSVSYLAMEAIVRTILTCAARWRKLTLSYGAMREIPEGGDFWDHLQSFATLDPPETVNFSINFLHADHFPLPLHYFPKALPIRSLSVDYCYFWNTRAPGFPENLQDLSVKGDGVGYWAYPYAIGRCLGALPLGSLRSLSLDGIFVVSSIVEPVEPCVLGSLESLSLERFTFNRVGTLLSIIHSPNIRSLSLKTISRGDAHPDPRVVRSWGALRFPKLEDLSLARVSLAPHYSLVELIRNLPESVTRFSIEHRRGETPTKDAVPGAISHPATDAFCSRLEHVVSSGLPLETLLTVVRGRCTSLESITVHPKDVSSENSAAEHVQTLRDLVPEFNLLEED